MRQYFVYILKCADGSYYTGITNDVDRRFNEHQSGYNRKAYTFRRRPLELVFYLDFPDPVQAIDFEKQVKGWTRKKKEAIIRGDWENLKKLAACKNETSHLGFDSAQPDSGSPLPDTNSTQPDSGSPLPDTNSTQPDSGSPLPDTNSTQPDSGSPLPDTNSTQPDSGSPLPDTNSAQPDSGSPLPDTNFTQPDSGSPLPDTNSTQPDSNVIQQPNSDSHSERSNGHPEQRETVTLSEVEGSRNR